MYSLPLKWTPGQLNLNGNLTVLLNWKSDKDGYLHPTLAPTFSYAFAGDAMVTNYAANGCKSVLTSARWEVLYAFEIIEDFPLYATVSNFV